MKAQAGSGVRRAATARPPTETAMHSTAATPQAGASAEPGVVANDEEHEGWHPQDSETPECRLRISCMLYECDGWQKLYRRHALLMSLKL